jgi:hypothetical protein
MAREVDVKAPFGVDEGRGQRAVAEGQGKARGKQRANLRPPWKPGESGNPKGGSVSRTLGVAIRELAKDQKEVPKLMRTFRTALGRRDARFWRMLLERVDPAVLKVEAQVSFADLMRKAQGGDDAEEA